MTSFDQDDQEAVLFEDVKAAAGLGKSLMPASDDSGAEVAAAERGRRDHPDGTVEHYERLEFRRRM